MALRIRRPNEEIRAPDRDPRPHRDADVAVKNIRSADPKRVQGYPLRTRRNRVSGGGRGSARGWYDGTVVPRSNR